MFINARPAEPFPQKTKLALTAYVSQFKVMKLVKPQKGFT